jgi:hypothetical protein
VAERIYAIGELRFGTGTAEAQRWVRLQLHQLKASQLSRVMRSIAHLQFDSRQAETTRAQVLGYLDKHRAAMDYSGYQQEGLPIGSGAVEGAAGWWELGPMAVDGAGVRLGVIGLWHCARPS